jgi:thioredoxin-related protein
MMLKILMAAIMMITVGYESPTSLQQKAKEQNKNIVIWFCGSDWCAICHQFKSRVLDEPGIDALISQKFIYYTADFPQRKKLDKEVIRTNDFLAEKFNQEGSFPKLVITDENFVVKAVVPNDADAATAAGILEKNSK